MSQDWQLSLNIDDLVDVKRIDNNRWWYYAAKIIEINDNKIKVRYDDGVESIENRDALFPANTYTLKYTIFDDDNNDSFLAKYMFCDPEYPGIIWMVSNENIVKYYHQHVQNNYLNLHTWTVHQDIVYDAIWINVHKKFLYLPIKKQSNRNQYNILIYDYQNECWINEELKNEAASFLQGIECIKNQCDITPFTPFGATSSFYISTAIHQQLHLFHGNLHCYLENGKWSKMMKLPIVCMGTESVIYCKSMGKLILIADMGSVLTINQNIYYYDIDIDDGSAFEWKEWKNLKLPRSAIFFHHCFVIGEHILVIFRRTSVVFLDLKYNKVYEISNYKGFLCDAIGNARSSMVKTIDNYFYLMGKKNSHDHRIKICLLDIIPGDMYTFYQNKCVSLIKAYIKYAELNILKQNTLIPNCVIDIIIVFFPTFI
eukprot:94038_1